MQNQKVVLITGASSGMGKFTARKMHEEGLIVYGVARRVEKMSDLKEMGVNILSMDVTDEASIENAIQTIMKEQGRIDVLVNNAGFGLYGSVEEIDLKDARYQFEVNIFGLASLTQKIIPIMRKQNSGTIINTSSMGGKIYTPLGAWYHATKHALEGWSDCLRLELNQFGINVVIIEPGLIDTEFGEVLMDPMLKVSGNGHYKRLAQGIAKGTQESYKKNDASPPKIISDVIIKAIKTNKPKTRYVAGKFAKPLIFIRKWFGDNIYDKIIMSQVK